MESIRPGFLTVPHLGSLEVSIVGTKRDESCSDPLTMLFWWSFVVGPPSMDETYVWPNKKQRT